MPNKPILFFDGQCPLCRREIAHYQRLDSDQRVDWQDLFDPATRLDTWNLDKLDAMRVIHAIGQDGQVLKGVNAFMVIWQELPYYRHLATVIRTLRLESLLNWAYLKFASRRFKSRCKEGCSLPPQP